VVSKGGDLETSDLLALTEVPVRPKPDTMVGSQKLIPTVPIPKNICMRPKDPVAVVSCCNRSLLSLATHKPSRLCNPS
jgi:hypothetical protein